LPEGFPTSIREPLKKAKPGKDVYRSWVPSGRQRRPRYEYQAHYEFNDTWKSYMEEHIAYLNKWTAFGMHFFELYFVIRVVYWKSPFAYFVAEEVFLPSKENLEIIVEANSQLNEHLLSYVF
jgi:hypothetical protein